MTPLEDRVMHDVNAGHVPHVRLGRRIVVPWSALEARFTPAELVELKKKQAGA